MKTKQIVAAIFVAALCATFALAQAPARTTAESADMPARVASGQAELLTKAQAVEVFAQFGRKLPTDAAELERLITADVSAAAMPIAVAVPFGGNGREVYMYTPPATAGWATLMAEDAAGRLTYVGAYGLSTAPLAAENRLATQPTQRPVAWVLNFQDQQGRSVNARYATATTSLPGATDRLFLDPLGNGEFLLVVVANDKLGVAQCYARPVR